MNTVEADLDREESDREWKRPSLEEVFKIERAVGWWKGLLDGEEQGERKGAAKILERQLTRRFGVLSIWVRATIHLADQKTLEKWSDLVLDACSLEEVIGPCPPVG
ncbi:MAG: DUF4351 domain-containing protein [Magnetococcus sp. YQC-5]